MFKFLWPARNILHILNKGSLSSLANVIPVFMFSSHVFKHSGVIEAAAILILPSSYRSKKKKWNSARSGKRGCQVVGAPLLISCSKKSRPNCNVRMALRLVKYRAVRTHFFQNRIAWGISSACLGTMHYSQCVLIFLMNTEQNNLRFVRLYFVTASRLLLTQILVLGR